MTYTNSAPDLVSAFDTPVRRTDTTSTTTLQQLFLSNFSAIREAVQESGPSLFAQDVDRITAGIADHISDYQGEPEGFLPWALGLATESATQASAFIAMRTEHSENVRRAIRSVVTSCTRLGAVIDDGQPPDAMGAELDETDAEDEQAKSSTLDTVDEIEQTVWLRVLADLPGWLAPGYSDTPGQGPATLKTRLWGFARLQALGWRTTQLRQRKRFRDIEWYTESNDPLGVSGRKVVCAVAYEGHANQ